MQRYNYKTNSKKYLIRGTFFIILLALLTNKISNTKKIYGDYQEAKEAYGREEYLLAHGIYTDLYKETKFNYLSRAVQDALKTEEMAFIEESIGFLEGKKADFESDLQNRQIRGMLETYDLYKDRSKEVKQGLNEISKSNYKALEERYNLEPFFISGLQQVGGEFKDSITRDIEAQDFQQERNFDLYASVLKKLIADSGEINAMVEAEKQSYYRAKMEWVLEIADLTRLFSEATQIIGDYGNLEEAGWITDQVRDLTIQKMKASIAHENYIMFKSYGQDYFTYIDKLPAELSDKGKVKKLVNDQLASDMKKLKGYLSKNKFEEAILQYDAINQYMPIADGAALDIDQLRAEIDNQWMKHDPIRMFGDLELTEISRGKSKWGRDAYVLAADKDQQLLYWGESKSQGENKKLYVEITLDTVQDISIYDVFSIHGNPVIMVEGLNEYGDKAYNGYEVFEESIEQIIDIETEYLESRAQGEVIVARDSYGVGLSYYEYNGYEYIHKFYLGDVEISNTDYYGNNLSGVQDEYSYYEINYINFSTSITHGDHYSGSLDGTLYIKYKDPDGNVMSISGYDENTWAIPISTSGTESIRRGFGRDSYGAYEPGWHTVEVWWNYMKITEAYFGVFD